MTLKMRKVWNRYNDTNNTRSSSSRGQTVVVKLKENIPLYFHTNKQDKLPTNISGKTNLHIS